MIRCRPLLTLALVALLLAPSCSSMGASRKDRMLHSAPVGYEVKLLTLQVTDTRFGRLTVEQAVVDLLARREGVLDVQRGSGREELYVLVEKHVDPYSLARNAPERYIVRVLSVEEPADDIDVPGARN